MCGLCVQAPSLGSDTAGSSSSASVHGSSGGANKEHAAKAHTTDKAVLHAVAGCGSALKETLFAGLPCTGLVLGGTTVHISV